jgi:mannose-1-phosphate guanylyltransferase
VGAPPPVDRGTAIELLWLLLKALNEEPGTDIVVSPLQQCIGTDPLLLDCLRAALARSSTRDRGVVLAARDVDEAAAGQPMVVPAFDYTREGTCFDVARFAAAPTALLARRLIARGALAYSGVAAAHGRALLRLFEHRIPHIVAQMRDALRHPLEETATLDAPRSRFEPFPSLDFATDILPGQEDELQVLRVPVGLPRRSALGSPYGRRSNSAAPQPPTRAAR